MTSSSSASSSSSSGSSSSGGSRATSIAIAISSKGDRVVSHKTDINLNGTSASSSAAAKFSTDDTFEVRADAQVD